MINVLFASDATTYPGLELAIYSLLTHTKEVDIYVFTMDVDIPINDSTMRKYYGLNTWHKSKLRQIVRVLDNRSRICFIDTLEYYDKYLRGGPNYHSCFTPYATLRLIADKALPQVPHILYLDCDTAVCSDITGLYWDYCNKDVNYSASFCRDACQGEGEMVSGVVLFNLDKNRRTGFLEQARKNYLNNQYVFPDQMAMRDADTAERMPEECGWCYDLAKLDHLPCIIHFTNQLSPKPYATDTTREYFYRKYPFLQYVKDGVEMLDTIFNFERGE